MTTIFVGGAQRTGSTLLQSLLCQAPGTNPMIMEAAYLLSLVRVYADAKRVWETKTEDYFDDPDTLRQFHSDIIVRFLENTASRFDDAPHLVLKEPHLTMFFPDLFELLPAAKFVVIMRDPRDTIASMIEVSEKMDAEGTTKYFPNRDMAEMSKHFKSFYGPILNAKNTKLAARTYFIRYEDLVTDPVAQLPGLREFTGLDIDLDLSDQSQTDSVSNRILRTKQGAWRTENYSRSLNPSSIGRHKTILTATEIGEIEKHCRRFLTAGRYV